MSSIEAQKKNDLKVKRVIGEYDVGIPGNFLLVTAGVHGNEPSGVLALQKVFKVLERKAPKLRGVFLGLAGNVKALNQNRRYIDQDLNRVWPDKHFKVPDKPNHEEQEMLDIHRVLEKYPPENFEQRFFVDCHSTSADSLPYISVQKIGHNDHWAHSFPLYIVRGFSDLINGSIDNHFSKNNFTGFAYEGGQHFEESTTTHQEAIIWLALENAGLLALDELGEMPAAVQDLLSKEKSKTFEIIHRHHLNEGDRFEMKAGYSNFQPIKKGEVLAIHNGEEVISQWDEYIFMPLYQKQGNDGFFVVKEVTE